MGQASSAGSSKPDTAIDDGNKVIEHDDGGDANEQVQSSGTEDATESTLADVVARAAGTSEEGEGSESSTESEDEEAAEGEASEGEAGEQAAAAKDDKTEDADVPFHKHPRWQELKRERDTFKSDAEQYQSIQQFMRVNQLEPEEVAAGYEIMALMRRDPQAALDKLLPYVQQLELVTGARLPDDLAARVNDGVVDKETAAETARLRFESQRRTAEAEAASRREQAQSAQATIQTIQSAVRAVEQEIRTADPDFARKQPFLVDRVRVLIAAEQPKTPEEASAIVRKAHSEVSELLKPMIQRKPVRTMTSGDSSTSGRQAPTSLREAIELAAKGNL
jgi:hypothetical protein